VRLVILRSARADILEIASFMRRDRPTAARRWTQELAERLDVLRTWPRSGRVVPEWDDPEVREVIFRNYRALYRIASDRVEVFLVIDGRRDLPVSVREPIAAYQLLAGA
jgi:toxin ParE1/3/4